MRSDIIAAARDNGINLLDTAPSYGINHLAETLITAVLDTPESLAEALDNLL